MNPDKRKENSQRRLPPLRPPQTEFGLCRLGNTDFQDAAERDSFAKIGPLPQDLCRQDGEFILDRKLFAEELILLDIKPVSIDFAQMMIRMVKDLPSAQAWKDKYEHP
jgi:hypothetical protein